MTLPTVTDHALLRWLERVEGYDIEQLRADIARSGAVGLKWGARCVIVGHGKLVLREGVVITVLGRRHSRRDLLGALEIEINHAIAAQRKTGRRKRPSAAVVRDQT